MDEGNECRFDKVLCCIKSFNEVYSWDEDTNRTELSITVVPIIRRTL